MARDEGVPCQFEIEVDGPMTPGVLVTGSAGFVGSHLCETLRSRGWRVVAAGRRHADICLPLLAEASNWQSALKDIDCVVHLAARVHVPASAAGSAAAFEEVNVRGSAFVAEQAIRAGVRRLVFLSTVKVNGEGAGLRRYRADDVPHPIGPYAVSKHQAEEVLRDVCRHAGMELVIVRPPLIYGPGVRANFRRLMQLASSGVPLPLGSVDNRRSLISVWNLASFIEVCMQHQLAAGDTWMVSDGEDLSTPQLIRRVAHHLHRPERLFRFSPRYLRAAARVLGLGAEMSRLCDSLLVDASPANERLKWRAPIGVDEALQRTVAAYAAERNS